MVHSLSVAKFLLKMTLKTPIFYQISVMSFDKNV